MIDALLLTQVRRGGVRPQQVKYNVETCLTNLSTILPHNVQTKGEMPRKIAEVEVWM